MACHLHGRRELPYTRPEHGRGFKSPARHCRLYSKFGNGRGIGSIQCQAANTIIKASASVHQTCPIDFLQLRGCLFDLDGTCADTEPLHYRVYQETLLEVGFNNGQPISMEYFRSNISGRHNPLILQDLFPDKPESWRTTWCDDREARFRKLAAQCLTQVRGLDRFTAWVAARGLRRAVVTNAPRDNAEVMVQGLGLTSFFETMVIGDECQRGKPYADPYKQGLVKLGLQHCPDKVLVLEDSPSGVRAGVAAGLPVIGLLCGGQPASVLHDAGATIVLEDFEDLMAVIQHQERATAVAAIQ